MSVLPDPASLPVPLTRFFGRTQERALVAARLGSGRARMLTLTGPGGVGKTRLALHIAAEVQARFTHGARFIPLGSVRDPAMVLPTLVVALGIEGDEAAEPAERLRSYFWQREMLLVLDNLEQVVSAGAALGELLSACPGLSALVTSRMPLRIIGEHVLPIAPLSVPDLRNGEHRDLAALAAVDAIALFADRAKAALPNFALTTSNVVDVAAICRHGDGLPLAIELAAARLRVLSPGELAARFDRRLPLLAGGPGDQPDRLQTMRAGIAWSYDLLSPAQQTMFRWLAVFGDGFGFSAVEHVDIALGLAGDAVSLDALSALVDASLVQRGDGLDGQARFTMLETIREFGLEQLTAEGEEDAAREAHASWCLAIAELAAPYLAGPDHLIWWNRLYVELGNIRAAHAWLFSRRDAERSLRLGAAMGWFWSAASFYAEGRALYQQLTTMPEARCFPALMARVLGALGNLEHWLDNLDEAAAIYARQLALCRDSADMTGVVGALRALGSLAVDRDDSDAARALLTEGLALAPFADAAWDAAAIANLLGIVAFAEGHYDAALRRSEEAIAGWQGLDDTGHAAAAQVNAARALLAAGNHRRAAERLCTVLAVVQAEVGDDWVTSDCCDVAAGIAAAVRDPAHAVQLLAAADAMFARMDVARRPCFQTFIDHLSADIREQIGVSAFGAAWETGMALSLAEAVTLARAVAAAAQTGQSMANEPATGLATLTARERDVLRLVAGGHSDKEIALALGIARHTASNHVSNIRAKLDSPSRAAVAALAVRDGLV